jgi:hypothetical protein
VTTLFKKAFQKELNDFGKSSSESCKHGTEATGYSQLPGENLDQTG